VGLSRAGEILTALAEEEPSALIGTPESAEIDAKIEQAATAADPTQA